MLKSFKKLLILVLVVSQPLMLHANDTKNTNVGMQIQLCENVIEAQDQAITDLGTALTTCKEQRQEYNRMLDEKNAKLASPWRNPWFSGAVGAAIGAVATAIVVGVVK